MRIKLNIDETLLEKASKLAGIHNKTALVSLGLKALISKEGRKRLASLGGTESKLSIIPRKVCEYFLK